MNAGEPLPKLRSNIIELLDRTELDSATMLKKLRELKEKHKVQIFSNVLLILTHLNFNESNAEIHFSRILEHRNEMQKKLERDIGLRVAALDYFLNIEKKLDNPKVVELSVFEETEKSALTDWLTGLHNQRFFRICLQKEFHRARRYKFPLSLLFLDIDNFKDLNDTYGHLFGDMILKEVSKILRRVIRDSDFLFRCGGEEFAVILPETARMGAYIVSERVRKGIEEYFKKKEVGKKRVGVTVSGGISVFPDDALADIEIIKKADQALYNAKATGKNRISVFYMERRSFIRFDISGGDLQVKIVSADGRMGREVLCAKNLSKSGILFEASEPYRVGEEVRIVIKVIKSKKRVEIIGRVIRLEEISYSDGSKGYDVGVAFLSGSEAEQEDLIAIFTRSKFGLSLPSEKNGEKKR
ncbi:MAG: diguanylate cyclase [Acidobacteriota bacterium]